jgi:DNA-binding NarL/FixJ family response regulator
VLVVDALRHVLDAPVAAAVQAERALVEAHELDDLGAIANAAGAAGLAAAIAGDLDGGLSHFDRALAAAARVGDGVAEARLASNRVFVLWRAGRPGDVERAAAAELERLRVRGLEALGDQLAVGRCGALLTLGRLHDAAIALAEARAMPMAADPAAHLDLVDAQLALARGEVDRASMLVERVASSTVGALPEVVGERWVVGSAIALANGERPVALAAAVDGLRVCAEGDSIARWRLVLAWWRATGGAGNDELIPSEISDQSDSEVVGAEQAALAATVAAHRERSRDAWTAAIDAWAAVPAPLEVLRCRLAAAVDVRDLDAIDAIAEEARSAGAFGLAEEAGVEWRSSGGRRAPKRTSGLLTEREVEVLARVAEGLTNKEVAERLYISVRTVGAHLERCMSKLGVGTRGAAVHEARRQGMLSS